MCTLATVCECVLLQTTTVKPPQPTRTSQRSHNQMYTHMCLGTFANHLHSFCCSFWQYSIIKIQILLLTSYGSNNTCPYLTPVLTSTHMHSQHTTIVGVLFCFLKPFQTLQILLLLGLGLFFLYKVIHYQFLKKQKQKKTNCLSKLITNSRNFAASHLPDCTALLFRFHVCLRL